MRLLFSRNISGHDDSVGIVGLWVLVGLVVLFWLFGCLELLHGNGTPKVMDRFCLLGAIHPSPLIQSEVGARKPADLANNLDNPALESSDPNQRFQGCPVHYWVQKGSCHVLFSLLSGLVPRSRVSRSIDPYGPRLDAFELPRSWSGFLRTASSCIRIKLLGSNPLLGRILLV